MKRVYLLTGFLICNNICLIAQPTGFAVDNVFHVSFKYDNGTALEQESSHWQPGVLSFWTDDTYSAGSNHWSNQYNIYSSTQDATLDIQSLVFRNANAGPLIDRVRLDYEGLSLVNGASWGALDASIWGNAGQLDLYTGVNGNYVARLGSTGLNSGRGKMTLYGTTGAAKIEDMVHSNHFGYSIYEGTNGTNNIYLGALSGYNSNGYIGVYDDSGVIQAGIYVNSSGDGIVFGDQKNFRIPDPTDPEKDIWYASLEGPEVGAYERGTATLESGEAFVALPAHYQAIVNHTTMTVNLTPLDWDTYGLAVVEKTEAGFKVKELKGGTGNFSFDWEVKCVRKGREDFKVYREALAEVIEIEKAQQTSGRFTQKVQARKRHNPKAHIHSQGCVHTKH